MGFFDWWFSLPAWFRFPIAVGLLIGSSWLFTHPTLGHSMAWYDIPTWMFLAGILLLFIGPSDS